MTIDEAMEWAEEVERLRDELAAAKANSEALKKALLEMQQAAIRLGDRLDDAEIAANIAKDNLKIKFNTATWVLKQEGGGISGHYQTRATLIDPVEFGVLSVTKDKKGQCSKIHVWSDGCLDGMNCFLINVPNGLFKIIQEPKVDNPIT